MATGLDRPTAIRPCIVVLGGYGVFGWRVAERLAREPDLDIVIAGRSAQKAERAAGRLARQCGRGIGHARLDATTAQPADLRALHACVLINASGPFQAQGYALARSAIAAAVHVIDLADARSFVTGITSLDDAARSAGVLVVSGASSVPGLSMTVLDHFAPQFARLTSVSHGISPGNAFDPGEATVASIIGAAGKPLTMRIDGQDRTVYGWQGLTRHRFPGLGARWMGHCDVPDLDLMPARYPTLRSVRFSAGVELALVQFSVWSLSWLARLGVLRDLGRAAKPLLAIKRRLGGLGSDRGGMFMTLQGEDAGGRQRRIDWHLEAGRGQGPYIPAIAAVIIAKKLVRGQAGLRGAMPCVGLFTLAEFIAEVADLDVRFSDTPTPLYRRVLGDRFETLPERVRALHSVTQTTSWSGRADVERGPSLPARLLAAIAGLPLAGRDQPLTVTFTPDNGEEIWTRTFARHVFRSVQGEADGRLWEQVGPARLAFELTAGPNGLSLKISGLRVLGVPVAGWLLPTAVTREWEEGGRYRFSVAVHVPLIGLLVRYDGWLEPAG